jgi:hypothetical protein
MASADGARARGYRKKPYFKTGGETVTSEPGKGSVFTVRLPGDLPISCKL